MSLPSSAAASDPTAIDPALAESTFELVARTGAVELTAADFSPIGEGCRLRFEFIDSVEETLMTLEHDIGRVGDPGDPALRADLMGFAGGIGAASELDADGTARLTASGWLDEPSAYFAIGDRLDEIDPDHDVRSLGAEDFQQFRGHAAEQREDAVSECLARVLEVAQQDLADEAARSGAQGGPAALGLQLDPDAAAAIATVARAALERDWPLIEHAARETGIPQEEWPGRICERIAAGDRAQPRRLSTTRMDGHGQRLSAQLFTESLRELVSPLQVTIPVLHGGSIGFARRSV